MNNTLYHVITRVGGGSLSPPELEVKARLLLWAGCFLVVFCASLFYFYCKYFGKDLIHRRLLFWVVGITAVLMVIKLVIFSAGTGYISDRLIFYAIPSPKFTSLPWALLAALSFVIFLRLRNKAAQWPAWKFLIFLWVIFCTFSLGIAGMRMGSFGIYEPFTRSVQDYAGDVRLIKSLPQFFHDFTSLNRELSLHGSIHPPGYTLLVYSFRRFLHVNFFGVAVLIVAFGGAFVFPVYYFWRFFMKEAETREALLLFLFTPSVVMFSATSMDSILLTSAWAALAVVYIGWRRHGLVAFAGGVIAALCLLFNFLFLLFGPIFLFFWVLFWRRTAASARPLLVRRTLFALAGVCVPLLLLYRLTGYSAIESFFVAHAAQNAMQSSNFFSVGTYLLYAFMNIVAFSFYLGVPNVVAMIQKARSFFIAPEPWQAAGFFLFLFLVVIGIFQGEIERIWLFITPLFLPVFYTAAKRLRLEPGAMSSLLLFQIVILQTLWYTFW